MTTTETRDVCIVGAGPAGLTAGLFTARAGLDTLVYSAGESILRRNAHLENYPGFPAGVDARRLLSLMDDQAERNGCDRREGCVTEIRVEADGRFAVVCEDAPTVRAEYVVCTSWADTDYLEEVDGVGLVERGSKTYVDVDEHGCTGVDGLYAAGRVAGQRHQTVIATGNGANVGLAVVEDSEIPFYHDWVAPEGYFTGRDRDVPPGCEEIDDEERRRRERESLRVIQDRFAEPHPDDPTMHPSVREE